MVFLDYSNRSRMTNKDFNILFCFGPNRLRFVRFAIFSFMYLCIFSSYAAMNFVNTGKINSVICPVLFFVQ
jgi:hypothetical protein